MGTRAVPYNVLLIEEDPKQSELYSDLIRGVSQCHVDVMTRVESASDWVARSNYQLVVVDTSVTGVNGLELLEQIKRLSPVTGVILISDSANVEEAVAAIRMGAEDYLRKPFNVETFQLSVKRGLDRKAIFAESSGASSFLNLLNSCQMISASLERRKIFGIVQSYFARELKSPHSVIYQLSSGSAPARVEDPDPEAKQDRAMQEILDIAVQASNPLSGMAADGEMYRFTDRGQLTPGFFAFRFRCGGPTDYFCVCLSPERPANLEGFESRLRMLRAQLEVTGKNIEEYQGVQSLVYVDDATGLYNTRYLHQILDREIAQYRASQKSFAVLFLDADKFKGINDAHGHLVGTKILNELGNQLKKFVRDRDTVFRYGGDEFVAVLSPCDLATAKIVAERIRSSVEKTVFLSSEEDGNLNLHFTVSIGVALFPDHAGSKQAVIEAADHAMYSSKRSTRNSVTIADVPVPSAQPPGSKSKPTSASKSKPAPSPIAVLPNGKKGRANG